MIKICQMLKTNRLLISFEILVNFNENFNSLKIKIKISIIGLEFFTWILHKKFCLSSPSINTILFCELSRKSLDICNYFMFHSNLALNTTNTTIVFISIKYLERLSKHNYGTFVPIYGHPRVKFLIKQFSENKATLATF